MEKNIQNKNIQNKIQKLSQILLHIERGMVKEHDLLNYCDSEDELKVIIKNLLNNFEKLGISLIRTTYQNERYYVLTKQGKDPSVSPSMYGVLALILATYNELGDDIPLIELKKIFSSCWDDIDLLIKVNYLSISNKGGDKYLEITPLAKASFKNIIKEINLKTILGDLNDD